MQIDGMLKHIRDEHHDGQDEFASEEDYDYPGEHESFDEGDALQRFRDCFREDIE